MQLRIDVHMWGDDELQGNHVIRTFDDLDKLASQVGRAVKRWARSIPVRKQGSRTQLDLRASWVERGGGKPDSE